ncbi:MAG: DUF4349 domain-containing protein [Lachnospiraceae bacterium]|nr:DUF4349 domain-containing protein [Lachnospiraceae bacterium]
MKKLLPIILVTCMILTGCGQSQDKAATSDSSYEAGAYETNSAGLSRSASYEGEEACSDEDADMAYTEDTSNSSGAADNSNEALNDAENKKNSAADKNVINKEMLVYTCNVSIRTDKFDDSYSKLKELINNMDGFIESENYSESDTSYNSSKTTNLTVRVPSKNYNTFIDSFGDIGTVSSKSSNAENVSQEYSDTEKALEIYEAELARYIERIKTIKDESTLLQLESKITDLQVTIAQLKSRRSQIETDVAYSYVYLTLSESVYKEETEVSFGGRFLNVIKRSAHSFLDICEGLLFFIILILPEAVIILIIVLIIRRCIKKSKKKKAEKKAKEQENTDK